MQAVWYGLLGRIMPQTRHDWLYVARLPVVVKRFVREKSNHRHIANLPCSAYLWLITRHFLMSELKQIYKYL